MAFYFWDCGFVYSLTSRLQLVVFSDVCAAAVFWPLSIPPGRGPLWPELPNFGQKLSCLGFFSLRKQELLKYFSIFFLSIFFFLSSSNFDQILPICHIYKYYWLFFWLFLIIFFRFFLIFLIISDFFQKNFLDILIFFYIFFNIFQLLKTFFTIQSFFNTIFTRALDLYLSLVKYKLELRFAIADVQFLD